MHALGRFGVPGVAVLRDHGLVTSGPFRLVRHPGYSAVLALWLGAGLGTLNGLLLALWPALVAVMYRVVREEEQLLRQKFGPSYEAYAEQTGRFLPKISRR
ncbi:MAG: methyltransferase family protein [Gemmatimonadota bacterium]